MRKFRIRSLVFAMLFAFAFTAYVQRTSVAVAAERMMPELGLTQVEVGWLFTAFLFTYAVFHRRGRRTNEAHRPFARAKVSPPSSTTWVMC